MNQTILESLNTGLMDALAADEKVFLLGEDLLDPYGGAFKVTRGLSSKFPDRVLTTPISEAAIVGIATGMALRGLRPVVEIMFGDFTSLIMDQVLNHASKFRWVYNDQVKVPLVIRTPMGGRRGYGPTHSQSLEKLFIGIPGLKTIVPNTLGDAGLLLQMSINDDDPVIFIEHKLLYPSRRLEIGKGDLIDLEITTIGDIYPTFIVKTPGKSQITLATYGYNFELARQAAIELLYEQEIFSTIIIFSELSSFNLDPLLFSIQETRNLITVEEGTRHLGWGSEICSQVVEKGYNDVRINRVAALNLPIANASSLEEFILPSIKTIKQTILNMVKL